MEFVDPIWDIGRMAPPPKPLIVLKNFKFFYFGVFYFSFQGFGAKPIPMTY